MLEGADAGEEADATFGNFGSSFTLSFFIVHNIGSFRDKSVEGGDTAEPDAQRHSNACREADPLFTHVSGMN